MDYSELQKFLVTIEELLANKPDLAFPADIVRALETNGYYITDERTVGKFNKGTPLDQITDEGKGS